MEGHCFSGRVVVCKDKNHPSYCDALQVYFGAIIPIRETSAPMSRPGPPLNPLLVGNNLHTRRQQPP